MRRFFKLIFQLVVAVLAIFFFTAVWVLFDGLTDLGEKADVALVLGTPESKQPVSDQPLLDRVVKLFNDGEIPYIIVSGAPERDGVSEVQGMVKFLTEKGIPSNVVLIVEAENTPDAARKTAEIMKAHAFNSIMIVTDYYHVTRTKLALVHDGVTSIQKTHVGRLHKRDAWEIGCEVVALYDYVGRVYVLPAIEKIKEEAKVGAGKAKVDAEEAKKKVDKGLDSMSK